MCYLVILMHVLTIRLYRLTANLALCIVSLSNLHALKIPRTLAAFIQFLQRSLAPFTLVCYWDRIIWISQNDDLCSKNEFRKLPLKVNNYRDFKKMKVKGSWIPYIVFSVRSRLTTSKIPDNCFEIRQNLLHEHASRKKKCIHGNNKPFMIKAY